MYVKCPAQDRVCTRYTMTGHEYDLGCIPTGLYFICSKKNLHLKHLGGSAVERLPWAQGVILESQDRVPHRVPCMEPASPSAGVSTSLSLCLS